VLIDQDRIRALIPHAGSMCLLDRVVEWGTDVIVCVATSHRDPANPLRRSGRLAAVCAVEYAGQAMALHGALLQTRPGTGRAGYLASVRELTCQVDYLDGCGPELSVKAWLLMADGPRVIYRFELRDGEQVIVSGHAAVALDAGRPRPAARPG
jgi:predicted hotdog family 3-hydroxylacyl-ACP dehydratase